MCYCRKMINESLAVHLTGNCNEASVLSFGAIYSFLDQTGAQDVQITGVTGERLNCGNKKRTGNRKKER